MSISAEAGAVAPVNESVATAPSGTDAAPDASSPAVVVTREQTPAEQREAADKALDNELRAVWHKNHPDRAADGRFASRGEAAATDGANVVAAHDQTNSAGEPQEASSEPAAPAIDAPHSWPAEMKAKWAAVPPDIQAHIAKRETEAHQAITRSGRQVKELEQQVQAHAPLDQVVRTHHDTFARRGFSPAQGVGLLLEAQRALDANPAAALVQIGLGYGIDLRPALQQAGVQHAAAQTDPRVVELENLVRQLTGRLDSTESKLNAREQADKEATEAQMQSDLDRFSQGKPYSDELRPLMDTLLSSRHAKDPAEAYDMAANAHPHVRERIQADQRAKDAEEKRRADEAKAAEARKAAATNLRSSAPGLQTPKTMDDTLKEIAYRRLGTG